MVIRLLEILKQIQKGKEAGESTAWFGGQSGLLATQRDSLTSGPSPPLAVLGSRVSLPTVLMRLCRHAAHTGQTSAERVAGGCRALALQSDRCCS